MLHKKKEEHIGTILALLSALWWGAFPVLVNRGTQTIPPILFAGLSFLLASFVALCFVLVQGNINEFKRREAYGTLLMVTVCIVIVPYLLFFIGASKTSGVNSSLLLLSEIIFTALFTHFIGEKTSISKLVGMGGVFFGALLILYREGAIQLNQGDALIILSTITFPIGNFYAKRAFHHVSPAVVLFIRFFLGGLFILLVSSIVESPFRISEVFSYDWRFILVNGLVLLGIGKIIYYEAFKRLDISKTISILTTFPLFSFIMLIGIFHEHITTLQWVGMVIMLIGAYFSISRSSVNPMETKYAPPGA